MKKYVALVLCLFIITGCGQSSKETGDDSDNIVIGSESFDEDFYPVLVNKKANPNRENMYLYAGSTYDYKAVGRGLQLLSLDHFSKNEYYMQEGQYLTISNMNNVLLARYDPDKNPYGLNPQSGSEIAGVANPIMVSLLSEQDYLQKEGSEYVTKAISIALVMYPETPSRQEVKMDSKLIEEYSKEASKRLFEYLRGIKGLENVPILIAIYQRSSMDDLNSGKYIGKIYSEATFGSYKALDQKIVVLPTDESKAIDSITYTAFLQFRTALKDFSVEAVGLFAEANCKEGRITRLNISINMNAKTYTEAIALTQYASELIDKNFPSGYYIQVKIESQKELIAVISKASGKDAVPVFIE